jgi:hypothetical protein
LYKGVRNVALVIVSVYVPSQRTSDTYGASLCVQFVIEMKRYWTMTSLGG